MMRITPGGGEGGFVRCATPEETAAAGGVFSQHLYSGDRIALCGELGAGKTKFVQGLASGLGCSGNVSSPTFAIVNEYEGGRLPLFHFDFYRVEDATEILSVGWDDYLAAGGVVVAEWGDRFPVLFPPGSTWLWIETESDGRGRRICNRVAPTSC